MPTKTMSAHGGPEESAAGSQLLEDLLHPADVPLERVPEGDGRAEDGSTVPNAVATTA